MAAWIVFSATTLGVGAVYIAYKRLKQLQAEIDRQKKEIGDTRKELKVKDKDLKAKDKDLKTKDKKLEKITLEKAKIVAKYQEKLKSTEVKKKSIEKYRKRKKKERSLPNKLNIEEIIGEREKWVVHSMSGPKSHKMGKPKGSKGGGRKRPEVIHKVIDLVPVECPHCGIDIKDQKKHFVYNSILTEINHELDEVGYYKVLKLINIQQKNYRRKCPKCNKWIYPDHGLFRNARFGPVFVGYVISKRIQFSMTYEDIILDMIHTFGFRFDLSIPSIIDWFKKFEEQIGDVYNQLELLIKKEAFLHIDESGLPLNGENWWLWVLCTANLVLFRESSSRGHKSIKDLIDGFEGTIIADFFSAYEKFDKNEHQKCLAHLLSDIIEIIVRLQKENERIVKRVQKHHKQLERIQLEKEAKETGDKLKRGRKPNDAQLTKDELKMLNEQHKQNERDLTQAVDLGTFFRAPFKDTVYDWKKQKKDRISYEDAEQALSKYLENLKKEGIDNDNLKKIVKRCEKYMPQLFTYLKHEGMPPDNNAAERALRKFARQRKISGDFKSEEVVKQFVSYLSLYMTCKANDRDFDKLIQDLLAGESVDLRMFLFDI